MQNIALTYISAKTVGMLQCLYPVVTGIFASLILGERLTLLGILGALVIIGCVILENTWKR